MSLAAAMAHWVLGAAAVWRGGREAEYCVAALAAGCGGGGGGGGGKRSSSSARAATLAAFRSTVVRMPHTLPLLEAKTPKRGELLQPRAHKQECNDAVGASTKQ